MLSDERLRELFQRTCWSIALLYLQGLKWDIPGVTR